MILEQFYKQFLLTSWGINIGATKSTQTFLYKFNNVLSTTLRVMDVRAESRGRPHQKVRFPVVPVVGRNFLTPGHPGVRVGNVHGKSGPKSLCLCCFFFPDNTRLSFITWLFWVAKGASSTVEGQTSQTNGHAKADGDSELPGIKVTNILAGSCFRSSTWFFLILAHEILLWEWYWGRSTSNAWMNELHDCFLPHHSTGFCVECLLELPSGHHLALTCYWS